MLSEEETPNVQRRAYRVVELATGDMWEFSNAYRMMDWIFAIGAFHAGRRFAIYKHRRRVPLRGGEVTEIARKLSRM